MFYDRQKFFDSIRAHLAPRGSLSQNQIDGFEILLAEGERRIVNTEWIAYVLATAWYETAYTMQPVRETLATSDQQAIDRLNAAYAAGRLGKVSDPYWRKGYFGRGYVQLTHEYNYNTMGNLLGIDLVGNPSLALQPDIAAKIIYEGMLRGLFTTRKLSDYIAIIPGTDATEAAEFLAARAIINGKDKAALISSFALKIEHALRGAELASVTDTQIVQSDPNVKAYVAQTDLPITPGPAPQVDNPKPAIQSSTIYTAIGGLVTTMVTTFISGLTNPVVQVALILVAAGFAWWIIKERMKGNQFISGLF